MDKRTHNITQERRQQILGVMKKRLDDVRTDIAKLLRVMESVDRLKLWAAEGYGSMFAFCVEHFGMSESEANKRIRAARMIRKFPKLLPAVASGQLHLSGLLAIAAHLTQDNFSQVIRRASHKSMREIDKLVAELSPKPDVPSTLRALPRALNPTQPNETRTMNLSESDAPTLQPTTTTATTTTVALPRPVHRAPDPTPLAPKRYKLTLTIDEEDSEAQRSAFWGGSARARLSAGGVFSRPLRKSSPATAGATSGIDESPDP